MNTFLRKAARAFFRPANAGRALWWHLALRWFVAGRQLFRQWRKPQKRYPIVCGLGAAPTVRGIALLDYVVDPFLPGFSRDLARSHANYWKTTAMVECLAELGYQVDVTDWRNSHSPSGDHYDLVMGQDASFTASCRNCTKQMPRIYLGWGLYANATIEAVAERVQQFQKRRNVDFRLLQSQYGGSIKEGHLRDEGPRFATDVFYIGDEYVRETYRAVFNGPLRCLPNAVVEGVPTTWENKDFGEARRHFMWLAAYGPFRRGLDILLETFEKLGDCHLWVCGDLKQSARHFCRYYQRELFELPNVHYLGWVDVASEAFARVTRRCAHLLYPSVSDGTPGSVVNTMAAGVVPIVTPGAGIDTGEWGLKISGLDHAEIARAVNEAADSDPASLRVRSRGACDFARHFYSQDAFRTALHSHLAEVLGRFDKSRLPFASRVAD